MAAVARRPHKSNRIDIRVTDEQKMLFERAAAIKGKSVTQWSVDCLVAVAQPVIDDETMTYLRMREFDDFATLLDEPMPKVAQELLVQKRVWE